MLKSWRKKGESTTPAAQRTSMRSTTPLTFFEKLIFFLTIRQQLVQDLLQTLPSEIYYKIFQLPSTAEIQLLHKINQLHHIFPKGSYWVTVPNTFILKLLLTPDTSKAEKIWAIENSFCYRLVSYSYQDRIHLFPTLTKASLKLRNLYSEKQYFQFLSTPPIWEDEQYKPAQHLVLISEYYGWWNTQPTQFLTTIGAEFYTEGAPIPQKVSRMNLEIDRVFIQLQMKNTIDTFPEGFHIFHHSSNWIFTTNVQGILKLLLSKFSGDFIHEPHRPRHL